MSADRDISEEDRALAGEYALGLLDAEAVRAFEARLVSEPALRAAYADWADSFAQLADTIEPVEPPAHVRKAIDARLFGTTASRGRGGFGWIGWLLGAGVAAALAFVLLTPDGFDPPGPALTAQIASEDGAMRIAAAWDAQTGELRLTRQQGDGPPANRSQELWLIAAGEGSVPVSLGVLPAVENISVAVPEPLRQILAGGTLAITDEPPGGSPTGQATGPIVAIGPITSS
ncbi:anti-sigma factor [Rhodobacteraceae bacterium F11138]|nr:anti-sigma factor [Rhodobacteraceae bacterium F11138]